MKAGVEARAIAAELVGRIDRAGAWSNVVTRELELSPEDGALVRHLLYGTIRNLTRIDSAIAALSSRPIGSIHEDVLDVVRVAFHEVLFGRAPDHAVASVSVEAVRVRGQDRASGFVNAMVRNLQRKGEPNLPDGVVAKFGVPQWLVTELDAAWGHDQAEAFFEESHGDAPIGLRLRQPGSALPQGAQETGVPGAFYFSGSPNPTGTIVQDPASVAVATALAPQPDDAVLDVGAAPGGKTLALWDTGVRSLVAVDNHPRRIVGAQRRTESLGYGGSWVLADGARLPFPGQTFDRVLLDAPCTGLGTLRRRPEIKFKVSEAERDRLAALQRRLLEAALDMVKPGGRLVYSVCTVTPQETTEVVAGRGSRPPDGLPGQVFESGTLMAPHLTGTDGMFIAVFDR